MDQEYQRVRLLGKGSFGSAYLFRRVDDQQLVVLKEVALQSMKLTQRNAALLEVEVLASLSHPNIISYYDTYVDGNVLLIEMEYADGGDLHRRLEENRAKASFLARDDAESYFVQLSLALAYVHQAGVIHRDIKPLNVFLTRSGVVKLGDFGVAKVALGDGAAETVTGTRMYMAPELFLGQGYTNKVDQWALGCVLYELLCCGARAFQGGNELALANTIVEGHFASLPETREQLEQRYGGTLVKLLFALLTVDAAVRPTAHECAMAEELQSARERCERRILMNQHSVLTPSDDKYTSPHMHAGVGGGGEGGGGPRIRETDTTVHYWGGGRSTAKTLWANANSTTTGGSTSATSSGAFRIDSRQDRVRLDVMQHEQRLEEGQRHKAVRVAAGGSHYAAITVDGDVFTWGDQLSRDNNSGQLGHGGLASQRTPKRVEALVGLERGGRVVSVACGADFTVCAMESGECYAFGSNYDGTLGIAIGDHEFVVEVEDEVIEKAASPVRVGYFDGRSPERSVVQVYCGEAHVCAVTQDGSAYVWGNGDLGRLGLGDEETRGRPVRVPIRGACVRAVACSEDTTLFLCDGGRVFGCGHNEYNKACLDRPPGLLVQRKRRRKERQLRQSRVDSASTREEWSPATTGNDSAGSGLACGGAVECDEETGHVDVARRVQPCRQLRAHSIVAMASGTHHSLFVTARGHVLAVGANRHGQLGQGHTRRVGSDRRPQLIKALQGHRVVRVACGEDFSVAATDYDENLLFVWGWNDSGRLMELLMSESGSVTLPRAVFGSQLAVVDVAAFGARAIMIAERTLTERTVEAIETGSSETSRVAVGAVLKSLQREQGIEGRRRHHEHQGSNVESQEEVPEWLADEFAPANSASSPQRTVECSDDDDVPDWLVKEFEEAVRDDVNKNAVETACTSAVREVRATAAGTLIDVRSTSTSTSSLSESASAQRLRELRERGRTLSTALMAFDEEMQAGSEREHEKLRLTRERLALIESIHEDVM